MKCNYTDVMKGPHFNVAQGRASGVRQIWPHLSSPTYLKRWASHLILALTQG